jgi:glycosyltransferase involved in cell wall biosynthesis
MFASMCKYGHKVRIIIYHDDHPLANTMPEGLEQLSIPRGTNFWTRRKFIREHMRHIPDDKQVVLHDTFIAEMALHRRHRWTLKKADNIRNILSLYAATSDFLFGGHWRGKSKEYRTSLWEWPYYLKRHGFVVLGEIFSCQLVDCIVGNSMSVINSLKKYYHVSPKRLRCIPAEVDTDFYCPGPAKKEELGLPKDQKIILYAGHYQRLKGIDILLKAFDIYARKNKDVRLVMVGDINDTGHCWFGDLLESLPSRSRIDIREKVPQHTLRDFYRASDLFVTASYHEGSPRVVKEAIACGLPVVASKIEGNLAIDPYQESLVLVDDWHPHLYAEMFEKVIEDDCFRHQRMEAGLKVAQNLSPDMVAQRYLELYKSLF